MAESFEIEVGDPEYRRCDPDELLALKGLPVANIGDAMDRLGIVGSGIAPIWKGAKVCGSAFTIWTRSGDNLAIHQALALVRPGDVMVINGGGDPTRALIGELIATRAKLAGVTGIVIDGAVRDAEAIAELGLAVFAGAISPAGPFKFGPGKLLCNVAIGGVSVSPGDVVVGDGDGIAVVPLSRVSEVAGRAAGIFANEEIKREGYYKGVR